jgi:hypothetical protein
MSTGKEPEPGIRTTRASEIFRDPPGGDNYSSSIGAAHGLELFGGSERVRRGRPSKTIFEPGRQIPVFAETDVLVIGGARPEPPPLLLLSGLAPTYCWLSATTT